jgi:tRNA A-37 threonylcarbamoyl transferase component Bud32
VTLVAHERRIGAWTLEERIGGGGQAAVYRARHAVLSRTAALKLVHPAIWDDPGFRVRFQRECDALVALDHPGIVPILDAGEHEGRGYLVMALARGGSLAARLAAGPLPPHEAVVTVTAVAAALDAAHAAGVLHRDVTPSNVLLDPSGPWLADFGLAMRGDATAVTDEGSLIGTAGYLAPEVIGGARATAASDRYALAATAYRALTGESPFRAEGMAGVLYAHVNSAPRRASEVRPGLPPALDAALADGLAKDPAHRPSTASALADAIAGALGATAAPTRMLVRRPPGPRRRPRRAVLAPALAVAALAAAGGAAATLAPGLGDGPPPPATPAANPRVTIPETVPGADGQGVRATAAPSADLPGGVAIPGAIAADVGDVRVVAFPGGWDALSAPRERLGEEGYVMGVLAPGGRSIGLVGRQYSILDILGGTERWALMVLAESTGDRAVLVRGDHRDPEAYATSLARARGAQVLPAG